MARVAIAGATALACGEALFSSDPEEPPPGTPVHVVDAGMDTSAHVDSAVDVDAAPPCEQAEEFIAVADSLIHDPFCNGSINYGGDAWVNLQESNRAVFRFELSEKAFQAVLNKRVGAMSLTLSREPTCAEVTGGCPASDPGPLQEFPLRSDWDEGTKDTYTGVDGC